ncbi:hypothetical protein GCM10009612_27090 [Streptomyces beijiangensis]
MESAAPCQLEPPHPPPPPQDEPPPQELWPPPQEWWPPECPESPPEPPSPTHQPAPLAPEADPLRDIRPLRTTPFASRRCVLTLASTMRNTTTPTITMMKAGIAPTVLSSPEAGSPAPALLAWKGDAPAPVRPKQS